MLVSWRALPRVAAYLSESSWTQPKILVQTSPTTPATFQLYSESSSQPWNVRGSRSIAQPSMISKSHSARMPRLAIISATSAPKASPAGKPFRNPSSQCLSAARRAALGTVTSSAVSSTVRQNA